MPVFSAGGLGAFAVNTSGNQGIQGTKTFSPLTAGSTAIVVQGLVSQTGNLQEWRNSAGTALTYIDPDGIIRNGGKADFTQAFLFGGS